MNGEEAKHVMDSLNIIERKLEWLQATLFRKKHQYDDDEILYHGWIKALPGQYGILRAMGVKGKMEYHEEGNCFWHCICGKAAMEALMLGFPTFWPECFTACVGEQQLPKGLQEYWHYPGVLVMDEDVVDGKWKCPRCNAIMKVGRLRCGNCMAYRTYLEADKL